MILRVKTSEYEFWLGWVTNEPIIGTISEGCEFILEAPASDHIPVHRGRGSGKIWVRPLDSTPQLAPCYPYGPGRVPSLLSAFTLSYRKWRNWNKTPDVLTFLALKKTARRARKFGSCGSQGIWDTVLLEAQNHCSRSGRGLEPINTRLRVSVFWVLSRFLGGPALSEYKLYIFLGWLSSSCKPMRGLMLRGFTSDLSEGKGKLNKGTGSI